MNISSRYATVAKTKKFIIHTVAGKVKTLSMRPWQTIFSEKASVFKSFLDKQHIVINFFITPYI
jgi:hypothetical protein